jgi:hypothetical protein
MGVEGTLAADGRQEDLDAAYQRHFFDLARLCRALGAGRDAEDLAQEVLIHARVHVQDVRDPAKLEGWLRTIAVRKPYRLKGRRNSIRLSSEEMVAPVDTDLPIDLATAIARLPARERAVLTPRARPGLLACGRGRSAGNPSGYGRGHAVARPGEARDLAHRLRTGQVRTMTPFWQRHISELDLAALADGAAATARQESHVAGCPRCAERLAAHRRIGRALATEWVNTTVPVPHAARTAPRVALAFPVVALAAVLVGALVFRGYGGPATPSQTPTAGLASETSGQPPTPEATPSPLPSAVVPIELPSFGGLMMNSIHWSPDGKHVIYAGLGWELLDDAGTVLKRVTLTTPQFVEVMYEATWLDSSHYAIGASPGTVTIYGLDGSEVQPQVVYRGGSMSGLGIVENGHGALAVAAVPTSFVVWADGSASKDIPGFPHVWSPDGTRLLVGTSSAQDPGSMADGAWWDSVAIVSYPGLQTTATFERVQLVANYDKGQSLDTFLSFSPDGRSIFSSWTRRQATPKGPSWT